MVEISKTPVSDFDAAVRLLSGGTNVAIYNDLGLPSVYVRKDKGTIGDVTYGLSSYTKTHPAFIVDGVEVPAFYMGKYLAVVYKGRALSLPFQNPTVNAVTESNRGAAIGNNVDFDNAKIWCEANGAGFHLATLPEYAWVALSAFEKATLPRGNNNNGSDYYSPSDSGLCAYHDGTKVLRTLTGSGPVTWNDNWKSDGICDLNGNVYEWQSGYRIVDGEIQILPNNNAAKRFSQGADSTYWSAILPNGTLVPPGTEGTLKWDYTSATADTFQLNNKVVNSDRGDGYGYSFFKSLMATSGVSVPDILYALALMPNGPSNALSNDKMFIRNIGERLTCRGGSCTTGSDAGVFCVAGFNPRSYHGDGIGFRPAFIPGI